MNQMYDVIILGAGPGGLQVAITLKELAEENNHPLNMLIIESGKQAGTFFTQYPVHGTLISNNKLYTGKAPESRFSERFDWNSLVTKEKKVLMRQFSREFFPKREALVEMLNKLVEEYQLPVMYETEWKGTSKDDQGNFTVQTNQGDFQAKHLVVATGMKPYVPEIPGIENATIYKDMKEKEYYRDKRVLVIGKGNSGMESAQEILNEASMIMIASRSSTRLAYKTHYVGDVRLVNAWLVDNYQLKHQAALLDCEIVNIEKVNEGYNVTVAYNHAMGETEMLYFHEVIAATGFRANCESLKEDLGVKFVMDKYPSIKGNFESTEVEGLYFAGTQTHSLDYRKTFSGFIHGFRYNSKLLSHRLAERLEIPLKQNTVAKEGIVQHILDELTESGDIYLQPGYLYYLLEYSPEGEWKELGHVTALEYKELQAKKGHILLAAYLDYGDINQFSDPLAIPREPGDPTKSVHIHPYICAKTEGGKEWMIELEEHLESQFSDLEPHKKELGEFINSLYQTLDHPVGSVN
ncbi:NAD(P)-binding domain-containing protein [Hazenella coriacea]|uniref:Thioredoxin reductase n=1 Tax=Hazenella coriacea TaxID=1179467 RepID=A0A4R3L2H2_9BACL|nr:NAD(P)-binding domain-containing protein [Hazenella coriacea]TCS92390.1 thioredoxin reductase [Hazenella coriacea]